MLLFKSFEESQLILDQHLVVFVLTLTQVALNVVRSRAVDSILVIFLLESGYFASRLDWMSNNFYLRLFGNPCQLNLLMDILFFLDY